ncbi:MAG TPA: SRPBCC domain-containing protein [Patescibacteria group bacterium]
MKTIEQTYTINAPLEKVWQALIDPIEIDAWGAGPAKMADQEDFEFSLWGGDIWGKNVEVEAPNKLVQDWYGGNWEKPSKVTFSLSEVNGVTEVGLLHENVPDEEDGDIETGWSDYYFGEIKKYLENSS